MLLIFQRMSYEQFEKQLSFLNVDEERMLRYHKPNRSDHSQILTPTSTRFVSTFRTPNQHVRASPVKQHPCDFTYYYFQAFMG